MDEKYKISSAQLILLVICSRIMFAYTYLPVINTPPHNQDAWIVVLISTFYAILLSLPVLFLINKFKGVQFDQIFKAILGNVIGKIFLLLMVLFFIYCSAACTLLAIVFINSYMFPDTPSWMLLLFIVLPGAYASIKGIGTISRLAFFVVPYILLTVVLFFLLSIGQLDFTILMPMFSDSSFLDLNLGGFLTAGYFSEALAFLVLAPYLKPEVNINKTFIYSALLFTLAFMVMVIPTLTLLGLDIARHSWNPYYMFTRQVSAFQFLQRVESLNVIAWFLGLLIKTSLFNFLACHTLAKVFGTKSHKLFVAPVFLGASIILLLPAVNRTNVIDFLRSYMVFPPIVLFYIVVLPVIAIIVYLFRRKKVDAVLKSPKTDDKKAVKKQKASSPGA